MNVDVMICAIAAAAAAAGDTFQPSPSPLITLAR